MIETPAIKNAIIDVEIIPLKIVFPINLLVANFSDFLLIFLASKASSNEETAK